MPFRQCTLIICILLFALARHVNAQNSDQQPNANAVAETPAPETKSNDVEKQTTKEQIPAVTEPTETVTTPEVPTSSLSASATQTSEQQQIPSTGQLTATTTTSATQAKPQLLQTPAEGLNYPFSMQFLTYNAYTALAAANKNANICFSPQLLAKQLTALRYGASGTTANEFLNALPAKVTVPLMSDYLAKIDAMAIITNKNAVASQQTPLTYGSASAIWVPKDYPIIEQYMDGLKSGLNTELYAIDFAGNRGKAFEIINAWSRDISGNRVSKVVDDATQKTIPENVSVLMSGVAAVAPRLVQPFFGNATHESEFHLLSGEKIKVPMMRRISNCPCVGMPDLQVVAMPCVETHLRLVILLPAAGKLDVLERQLTLENLTQWFGKMQPINIDMMMPRLQIDHCNDLTPVINQIGVNFAISDKADFSNMSQSEIEPSLYLSKIMQADQFVLKEQTDTPPQNNTLQPQAQFHVNRPFVFVLWNVQSGTVMQIGRVVKP